MTTRTQQIEQLLESFQAIKRRLGSQSAVATNPAFGHITHSQWGVLRIIAQKDSVTVKDIAAHLDISSSAATQLVDGLVENGHLERKDNPEDRRSHSIMLSGKTKAQMQSLKKERIRRFSDVFSALSEDELEQYLFLSNKVASHFLHS